MRIATPKGAPVEVPDEMIEKMRTLLFRAFESRPSNTQSLGYETLKVLCWLVGRDDDERWALLTHVRSELEEYEDRHELKRFRRKTTT